MRRVTGPAGVVGVDDADHRIIGINALSVENAAGGLVPLLGAGPVGVELPLLAVFAVDPAGGHAGAQVIGRLHRVWLGSGGLVQVEGSVDVGEERLPDGTWPCGLDLVEVVAQLSTPDGRMVSEEWIARGEPVIARFTAGRIAGVTVYGPESGLRAAFPAAALTIGPERRERGRPLRDDDYGSAAGGVPAEEGPAAVRPM